MRTLKKLRTIDRNADYYKKELETIKRNQEKLESSFAETKAELKAMNSRINSAEEQISDLEDRIIEITQSEEKTKSQRKKESNIRDLWDNIKQANLRVIGIPDGEEKGD